MFAGVAGEDKRIAVICAGMPPVVDPDEKLSVAIAKPIKAGVPIVLPKAAAVKEKIRDH